MSLSAREKEALDGIAAGLAGSDSDLAALLGAFTRLAAGEQMPNGEEVKQAHRWPHQGPRRNDDSHSLAWLQTMVILIVTALIAVTAVLSRGDAKAGACTQVAGLTCVSHVPANP